MLDTGTYPEKVKVSDTRMKDLEDRVLDRHAFRGEWNYTVRPAPAAPDPAPPPPGPDLAALAALAGVPDLAALLGAVAVPWQACREQRLHLARGGARRKQSGCGPRQLPFEAIVAAAACHIRLGMTYYLLSQLLGAHDSTISLAAGRITPLLEEHGITPQAGRTRISTLDQLREHAAAHGITITGITSQTPQEGAYQDDTPKTVN